MEFSHFHLQDEIQRLSSQLLDSKNKEVEHIHGQVQRNDELNRVTQRERDSLLIMAKQLSDFSHDVMKRTMESEKKIAAAEEKEMDIARENQKLEAERIKLESAKNTLSNLKMEIVRQRIVLLKNRRDA